MHDLLDLLIRIIFESNDYFNVDKCTCVDIASLKQSCFNREHIKVPQSLQMETVVSRVRREDWVSGAKESCDGLVCAAEGVCAASQEEEADSHVDRHVVAVMHLTFEAFPENSQDAEAGDVALACHHHS